MIYTRPNGSICRDFFPASPTGKKVTNRCGSATAVAFQLPKNSTQDRSSLKIYRIDFDCSTKSKRTPTEPAASTEYSTEQVTVTSCGPSETNCPGRQRPETGIQPTITKTQTPEPSVLPAYHSLAQSTTSPSSGGGPAPTTFYSTEDIIVTSCAPDVTDCPGKSSIGPKPTMTETRTASLTPSVLPAEHSSAQSTTTTTSLSSAGPAPATFYSTEDIIVTSCAPDVTDCPGRSSTGSTPTTPSTPVVKTQTTSPAIYSSSALPAYHSSALSIPPSSRSSNGSVPTTPKISTQATPSKSPSSSPAYVGISSTESRPATPGTPATGTQASPPAASSSSALPAYHSSVQSTSITTPVSNTGAGPTTFYSTKDVIVTSCAPYVTDCPGTSTGFTTTTPKASPRTTPPSISPSSSLPASSGGPWTESRSTTPSVPNQTISFSSPLSSALPGSHSSVQSVTTPNVPDQTTSSSSTPSSTLPAYPGSSSTGSKPTTSKTSTQATLSNPLSSALPAYHSLAQPTTTPASNTGASPTTLYSTKDFIITSCAASVTDCPGRSSTESKSTTPKTLTQATPPSSPLSSALPAYHSSIQSASISTPVPSSTSMPPAGFTGVNPASSSISPATTTTPSTKPQGQSTTVVVQKTITTCPVTSTYSSSGSIVTSVHNIESTIDSASPTPSASNSASASGRVGSLPRRFIHIPPGPYPLTRDFSTGSITEGSGSGTAASTPTPTSQPSANTTPSTTSISGRTKVKRDSAALSNSGPRSYVSVGNVFVFVSVALFGMMGLVG